LPVNSASLIGSFSTFFLAFDSSITRLSLGPISGWKALVVSSTTHTVFISPVAWSILMPATLPTPMSAE
jgi:hypothetical protein